MRILLCKRIESERQTELPATGERCYNTRRGASVQATQPADVAVVRHPAVRGNARQAAGNSPRKHSETPARDARESVMNVRGVCSLFANGEPLTAETDAATEIMTALDRKVKAAHA